MLDSVTDHHVRVRSAEVAARVADMLQGDFMVFNLRSHLWRNIYKSFGAH